MVIEYNPINVAPEIRESIYVKPVNVEYDRNLDELASCMILDFVINI